MTAHTGKVLRRSEYECRKCDLHKTCKYSNKIDYRGSDSPDYLFVGQNPGRQEDKEGRVFVGESGNLLFSVIEEAGYDLDKCAFTNAVKCWSGEGNPAPTDTQARACAPFLKAEIELLKPKVIIMLGGTALKSVSKKIGIKKLRGTAWQERGVYYAPTWHPSYVIRSGADSGDQSTRVLREFCDDIEKAKDIAERGIGKPIEANYELVSNYETAIEYFELFESLEVPLDFDVETHGQRQGRKGWVPDPYAVDACVLTVAFSWESGYAVCIPLCKEDSPIPKRHWVDLLEAWSKMVSTRNKRGLKFGAFNASFDVMFPHICHNIPLPQIDFDPHLAHHLLNEELPMPGLSQLTWLYTDMGGYDTKLFDYVLAEPDANPKRGGTYGVIPYELLGYYNCGDADATNRLRHDFIPKLEDEGLMGCLEEISLPATYVVADYQHRNGVCINRKFAHKLSGQYLSRMEAAVETANSMPDVKKYERSRNQELTRAYDSNELVRKKEKESLNRKYKPLKKPEPFAYNIGSRDQNRELLFDRIGIDTAYTGKTPSGRWVLDKGVLADIQHLHPLPALLQDYAKMTKFYGTYVKPFSSGLMLNEERPILPFIFTNGHGDGALRFRLPTMATHGHRR